MELRKKRVLIIGANGKLGCSLVRYFSVNPGYETLCAGVEERLLIGELEYIQVDITKRTNVKNVFHSFFPDVVINAAGFTNVDLCESNRELSWNINVKGTENIAMSSWAINAHMIHISTDYIFDGKEGPYTEEDIPRPINYYGRSKLAAENSLRTSGTRFTIFRTNVLYGSYNRSLSDFVRWVMVNLKEGKKINVVTDQINNPVFIEDFVPAILKAVKDENSGIYNIGGSELLTRFEFARRIACFLNLDENLILPVATSELKQAALRPLKSGFIYKKAAADFGYSPRSFEETFKLMSES